nr:hypothetical protein [Tanacetum cinerariifolium]
MANKEQALPQQQMAKNPVPFTHAKQVGFKLEDVILNSNNEVALLYPEHSNKEEYLSKFWYSTKALDNSKVYISIPTSGIYRELGVNIFRKSIGADYLSHSSDYVDPPFIDMPTWWQSAMQSSLWLLKLLEPPHKLRRSGEATKSGSSKAPTDSKTGLSRKRKESCSAK